MLTFNILKAIGISSISKALPGLLKRENAPLDESVVKTVSAELVQSAESEKSVIEPIKSVNAQGVKHTKPVNAEEVKQAKQIEILNPKFIYEAHKSLPEPIKPPLSDIPKTKPLEIQRKTSEAKLPVIQEKPTDKSEIEQNIDDSNNIFAVQQQKIVAEPLKIAIPEIKINAVEVKTSVVEAAKPVQIETQRKVDGSNNVQPSQVHAIVAESLKQVKPEIQTKINEIKLLVAEAAKPVQSEIKQKTGEIVQKVEEKIKETTAATAETVNAAFTGNQHNKIEKKERAQNELPAKLT